jgi:hypothetical protein
MAACHVPYEVQTNFSLQSVDKDNILSLSQLKYRVQKVTSTTQSFKKSTLPYTSGSSNISVFFGLRKYCNSAVKLENDQIN